MENVATDYYLLNQQVEGEREMEGEVKRERDGGEVKRERDGGGGKEGERWRGR